MPEQRVRVSVHAIQAARRRFPELLLTEGEIRREVQDAFAAGRVSLSKPAFLCGGKGRRADRWYAWDSAETRAYALVATEETMIVTTTLSPGFVEALA